MIETITLDVKAIEKILILTSVSFIVAMLLTPFWTNFLYKYKLGKKIRDTAISGEKAVNFLKYHKYKEATPTMGGVLVWGTTLLVTLLFNYNYRTTLLPLFALCAAGLIGLFDDLLNIYGIGPHGGGLKFRHRLYMYGAVAAVSAYWFAFKLDWIHKAVHIPGWGGIVLGSIIALLFFLVLIGTTFAVDVTDGLDGLAGGLLVAAFLAITVIATVNNQIGIAAFSGTIAGALLAFLWFNIYPARFIMGGTGAMSLGTALAVLAFLTNSIMVLPIIGFVFVVEGLSVILQLASKKLFHKKIFLSAPIHHHFQALGWPETKVTQRAWIIGAIGVVIGLVIALVGRG